MTFVVIKMLSTKKSAGYVAEDGHQNDGDERSGTNFNAYLVVENTLRVGRPFVVLFVISTPIQKDNDFNKGWDNGGTHHDVICH